MHAICRKGFCSDERTVEIVGRSGHACISVAKGVASLFRSKICCQDYLPD